MNVICNSYITSIYSLNVLFTFDKCFTNEFNGKDGKSDDEHMKTVIALVKNAYNDKSLKNNIGTKVNIIGATKKHSTCISSIEQAEPIAKKQGDYDLFTFVTFPGAGGLAWGASVCKGNNFKDWKVNHNMAYDSYDCNIYNPPQSIDCTPTNRIVLTAEVNMKPIIK